MAAKPTEALPPTAPLKSVGGKDGFRRGIQPEKVAQLIRLGRARRELLQIPEFLVSK